MDLKLIGAIAALLAINHAVNWPMREKINNLEGSIKTLQDKVITVNEKIARLDRGQELIIYFQGSKIDKPTMNWGNMTEGAGTNWEDVIKGHWGDIGIEDFEGAKAQANIPKDKDDHLPGTRGGG